MKGDVLLSHQLDAIDHLLREEEVEAVTTRTDFFMFRVFVSKEP